MQSSSTMDTPTGGGGGGTGEMGSSSRKDQQQRNSTASVASGASSVASDFTFDSQSQSYMGMSIGSNQTQILQLRKNIRNEHKRLSDYEAQRRSTYSSKLESTSLYFKSLVDLSKHSIAETSRAHRLVVGMSLAHSKYSQGLQNSIIKPKSSSLLTEKDEKDGEEEDGGEKGKDSPTKEQEEKQQQGSQSSLLSAWETSNANMAQQFQKNATFIDQEISSVMSAFLDATVDQKDQLESVGNPILIELEEMEKEVQKAWGK